jgi:hypothetical protein
MLRRWKRPLSNAVAAIIAAIEEVTPNWG